MRTNQTPRSTGFARKARPSRIVAGLLAAGLAAGLAACGGSQAGGQIITSPPPSREPVKVEVTVPAGVNPIAWMGERAFPLVAAGDANNPNPVYSPLSVYLAFGMVADGARGNTAVQLAQFLGADPVAVNAAAQDLVDVYAGYTAEAAAEKTGRDVPPIVRLANSAWADDELTLLQAYIDDLETYYQAELVNLDLQDVPAALEAINGWVADKTEGLIDTILDDLNSNARLVLLNALYFKGLWSEAFETHLTQPGDFTLASGGMVRADFMAKHGEWIDYFDVADGTRGVVLPYKGGRFAMVVALPAGGLDTVTWDGRQLRSWLDAAVSTQVNLRLPKWEAETGTIDLIPVLQELGVTDLFDGALADLTGIGVADSGQNLYVSDALHKAVVKVYEDGTEAAA
ncbi:MAG: hypothetical protein LBR19_07290, partial [Bifidobacteriaceae bacterium]|nr:hypothetical protein [Bifidobacteriaceae bacterium]